MTTDEVRERLESAGHVVKATSRLGNNYGDQLLLKGAVVNVFDKGTIQVQGKDQTLINRHGPWRSVEAVERATARWVHFWNTRRLHGACDDVPPAEFGGAYHSRQATGAAA